MNRLQLRASARFKLFAFFVPLMLLAVIACNIGEAELVEGILQNVDSVNGEITIVTKDGKTVTLTIATEAPVETDGASSALETLEPGASVEVEVTEDGQVVRSIKARQTKVDGTIAEIEGNEVTVESERGRRFTVTVNDRTRINLEDDFPGTLADLQVSTEVEIKFDPESRAAFKIDAEEEEADIKGVVAEVAGNEVTVETERGRRLTLVIGDRTRIGLEDDFSGTVADIQVGTEVEAKFDPFTRTAVKIELEETDEKRRQVKEPEAQSTPAPLQEPLGTHEPPSPEAPTANFRLLISDDRNAIDDFTHLWVTIDRVGIHQGGESESWQELEVPEEHRKVDLVEVIGDAAVEIIRTQIPPGRYSKVFIHVDDVTGELQSGITTPVKLPSSKLQIVKGFEVQTGSVTSFVFEVTIVAAGNEKRGIKYILKPVIAQSGADRPLKEVKPERGSRGELTLQLEGDPQPGATSTLVVTDADSNPVEGAAVRLKVEWDTGTTDANGRLTIDIPMGTTEFRIEAESEDLEGELRAEFLEDGIVEIETDDEELVLQLDGIAEPGATLTLIVVDPKGDPVPDVKVSVKVSVKVKREAGTTDVNGQLIIDVPEGTIELHVEARLGDERGELEVELSREDGVTTTGPEGVPSRAIGPMTLQLEGDPQPGATSTLVVTDADGNAVEGAVVMINGEVAGITDDQGRLSFSVQEGADELKIKVKLDESKGELEVDLEDGGA